MDHDNLSAEEIAKIYSSAMNSANLIDAAVSAPDDYTDDPTIVERNAEHLKLVVEWDFWTDQDMTPFENAIASANKN